VIAYVGDTRARNLLALCRAEGVGQIIVRGRLRGRRLDLWAYDNGAFEDWRNAKPFDSEMFEADLATIDAMEVKPRFCVLPDVVQGGLESLRLSTSWLDRKPRQDWYLAVQDGMVPADVPWGAAFVGIFVGGSLDWKLKSGAEWVRAAHEHGMPCHIGRVGTKRRVMWAKQVGADSIDSCLPMWSKENARAFFGALRQHDLGWQ
jgi:hypothetical protein